MTTLTTLIQNLIETSGQPMVHALGWTLLHFLWQGTVVAGALWCALGLLSGRSSQARYAAACLSLALLVAVPVATFAHIASADLKMRSTVWNSSIPIDPGVLLPVAIAEPAASWPVRAAIALDHWIPWMLLAWFAGVILFVGRLNIGLIVARRLKSASTEPPSDELQGVFDKMRARLGVTRAVRLMHSALVDVPTVIGWLRPVVLVPLSCLTGLSAVQIEAIFCHELAHVRRHDYLVSVFQSVVEAMLFYHPAVWWVSKQVRRERECCCDELAVGMGGDVLAYAKALSYLEERRADFPEVVLGANGGVLKMRIRRLLGSKEDAVASQSAALAVLAVVLAVAGSYAIAVARAQTRPAKSAALQHNEPLEQVQSTQEIALATGVGTFPAMHPMQLATTEIDGSGRPMSTLYRNWVDQDVLWIITPEERAAFLKLTNDNERDQFIEQFWAHRDPPGAPKDTFRDEHYARIAYANEHFAANKPGWSTDRGRVYIVLGKPLEVDAHPSGGQLQGPNGTVTETAPFEVWRYKAVGGTGQMIDVRFVDSAQNGDYRLSGPAPLASGAMPAPPPPPVLYLQPGPVSVGSVFGISTGTAAGMLISRVDPVYPEIAKAAHVQGTVILNALISKTGTIENLQVVSGQPMLTSSAMEAVRQWTYKPYLLNGEPVDVEATIAVSFHLSEDGTPSVGPADPDPIRVAAGVVAGMMISKVDPVYPPEAKAAGIQGAVVVHAIISKLGTIENLQVISGPKELMGSALDAIRQWRYRPYLLNGEPTEVQTTITVNYSIGSTANVPAQPAAPEALARAEQEYRDLLVRASVGAGSAPVQPVAPTIREIDYKGLNSVTISEVAERFEQDEIGLKLETPYDPSRIARAVAVLKSILAEHGRPYATVDPKTTALPRGAIRILFEVKEGAKLAQGVTTPVPIYEVQPEYTAEARKAKTTGIVLLNLVVDEKGKPQAVHVLHGIGNGLDKKAVESVQQYKFKPATLDGKPVARPLNVEVNFQIF